MRRKDGIFLDNRSSRIAPDPAEDECIIPTFREKRKNIKKREHVERANASTRLVSSRSSRNHSESQIEKLVSSLLKREKQLGRYNHMTALNYASLASAYESMGEVRAVVMYRTKYRIDRMMYGQGCGSISGPFRELLEHRGLLPTDIFQIQKDVIISTRREIEGDWFRRYGRRQDALIEYHSAARIEEVSFGRDNPDLAFLWRKMACLAAIKKHLEGKNTTDVSTRLLDFEKADQIGSSWMKSAHQFLSSSICEKIRNGDRYFRMLLYSHAIGEYFKASCAALATISYLHVRNDNMSLTSKSSQTHKSTLDDDHGSKHALLVQSSRSSPLNSGNAQQKNCEAKRGVDEQKEKADIVEKLKEQASLPIELKPNVEESRSKEIDSERGNQPQHSFAMDLNHPSQRPRPPRPTRSDSSSSILSAFRNRASTLALMGTMNTKKEKNEDVEDEKHRCKSDSYLSRFKKKTKKKLKKQLKRGANTLKKVRDASSITSLGKSEVADVPKVVPVSRDSKIKISTTSSAIPSSHVASSTKSMHNNNGRYDEIKSPPMTPFPKSVKGVSTFKGNNVASSDEDTGFGMAASVDASFFDANFKFPESQLFSKDFSPLEEIENANMKTTLKKPSIEEANSQNVNRRNNESGLLMHHFPSPEKKEGSNTSSNRNRKDKKDDINRTIPSPKSKTPIVKLIEDIQSHNASLQRQLVGIQSQVESCKGASDGRSMPKGSRAMYTTIASNFDSANKILERASKEMNDDVFWDGTSSKSIPAEYAETFQIERQFLEELRLKWKQIRAEGLNIEQ